MNSTAILVVGESGSGKSTSIESLNPKETFIINVKNKPMPFKGYRNKYTLFNSKESPDGNYFATEEAKVVIQLMLHISNMMPNIKNIVIDDFQYVSASEYMKRSSEKGFDKFVSIAKNLYDMADLATKLREDLFIVFMNHAEESMNLDGDRRIKAKTVGKLIDNAITLEGLFTYVLYTEVRKIKDVLEYTFLTQNNGSNTAKSPKGCLELREPNDLNIVIEKIKKYDE